MKLNIEHHGRGVFRITGMRAVIKGHCQSVNLSVRLTEVDPIPSSYCDIALNDVLMSQIAVALEKMDYTPSIMPCVDCRDCILKCGLQERSTNEQES